MSQELTTRLLSAFAKLDLLGLTHAQRLEALAKAAGEGSYAAMKASEKKAKSAKTATINDESASFVTVVAFGRDLTSTIHSDEPLYSKHGDFVGGTFEEHSFKTLEELKAYHQGLADMDGWMDAETLVSQADDPDHDYIAALKANPKLTYEAYYEANRKAEKALDDYHLDENVVGYQVIRPDTNETWNDHPSFVILSMETAQSHIKEALRAGRFEFEVCQIKEGEIEEPSYE